ncbi:hypothetical protein UFOVP653_23 [uncultured Caudovirales phage]|uniref:DUF3789 domain-containing protein n=1 Tax=uncultured Caudovirales phage TaxID=2100421 RepID=A0A6J5N714_9CAUD|nr:hypothetical protein UFOVP653_23 [uncultured Caudovirales phage]
MIAAVVAFLAGGCLGILCMCLMQISSSAQDADE